MNSSTALRKKNKGSFMIYNNANEIENIISTNQKYLSLKKPTNLEFSNNSVE